MSKKQPEMPSRVAIIGAILIIGLMIGAAFFTTPHGGSKATKMEAEGASGGNVIQDGDASGGKAIEFK